MVDFIKMRIVKSRLFALLYEEMEAERATLLLHTEVRLLSRGKMLARVHELQKKFFVKIIKNEVKLAM